MARQLDAPELPIDITAVECHRQNACDRRLANAPVAAEDVAVRDASLGEGVHERYGDVVLSRDICEALGTVLSC